MITTPSNKSQYNQKSQVEMHACNPSTQGVEAGKMQVPGRLGLHSETLIRMPHAKRACGDESKTALIDV
jgi:hypothetical protein